MSELKADFNFEIGDIVYFKAAIHDERHTPLPHIVVERLVQECHGGIQTQVLLDDSKNWCSAFLFTKVCPSFAFSEAFVEKGKYTWGDFVEKHLEKEGGGT